MNFHGWVRDVSKCDTLESRDEPDPDLDSDFFPFLSGLGSVDSRLAK